MASEKDDVASIIHGIALPALVGNAIAENSSADRSSIRSYGLLETHNQQAVLASKDDHTISIVVSGGVPLCSLPAFQNHVLHARAVSKLLVVGCHATIPASSVFTTSLHPLICCKTHLKTPISSCAALLTAVTTMGRLATEIAAAAVDANNLPPTTKLPNVSVFDALLPRGWTDVGSPRKGQKVSYCTRRHVIPTLSSVRDALALSERTRLLCWHTLSRISQHFQRPFLHTVAHSTDVLAR